MRSTHPSHPKGQRGLSIIELMVGIAIGLIVVAGAATLMATQLVENRKLLIETQLQQDLRATADTVARALRRAGTLPEKNVSATPSSVETVYVEGTTFVTNVRPNNVAPKLVVSTGQVDFDYAYAPTSWLCCQGFKLDTDQIKMRIPGPSNSWEPLTDPKVMKVTRFDVTVTAAPSAATVLIPCAKACPGGGTACWPELMMRDVNYVIEAEATSDSSIKRAISGRVRVRADYVNFRAGASTFPLICPA